MSACVKLGTHIPASFDPIDGFIREFLEALGEERCAVLDAVCEGYSEQEYDFLFYAMMGEMSRLTFRGFNNIHDARLRIAFRMFHAAAHAAPAAAAFRVGRQRDIQGELRTAGDIINQSRADEWVIEMPDMNRHDPVILHGAVVASTLNLNTYTPELIRYLGENWRTMAPHREMMQSMTEFDLPLALYLINGGSTALTDGVL